MTQSKAGQTKIRELIQIIAEMTGMNVGFYSQTYNTSSSAVSPCGTPVQKEDKTMYLFLYSRSNAEVCYFYEQAQDWYYLSMWVPAIDGFIMAGPYRTHDAIPAQGLMDLETIEQHSATAALFVSKHYFVQSMMTSMIRHYSLLNSEPLKREHNDRLRGTSSSSEKSIIDYIRREDPESGDMLKALEEASDITFGAEDIHMHMTNKLYVTCVVMTRALIAVGMEASEALLFTGSFFHSINHTETVPQLKALRRHIMTSFDDMIQRERNKPYSPFIRQIRDFIRHHLQEPLDVKSIADHMNLSPGHVSTVFKKESGKSLKRYIAEVKVKEAKRWMIYSDMPLSEIAVLLCFNDQTYFTKVFKRITGQTPLQYRKHHPPNHPFH
ncbi:helix-turn-helix domain-containing protein [Salibacterium lacus]|uniref:Helix-turn-helix domain-containing protein n=1 Tax=Salibacterium lacus TaxID=1898109 RepID=A0ABW5T3D4_9BACI